MKMDENGSAASNCQRKKLHTPLYELYRSTNRIAIVTIRIAKLYYLLCTNSCTYLESQLKNYVRCTVLNIFTAVERSSNIKCNVNDDNVVGQTVSNVDAK